jgi:hypothetical protein
LAYIINCSPDCVHDIKRSPIWVCTQEQAGQASYVGGGHARASQAQQGGAANIETVIILRMLGA